MVAKIVGDTVGDAGLDAAAGQPDAERVLVVVAADPLRAVAFLVHRRAAEFAAPDDQRAVEQTAPFQVPDQGSDRLIGLLAATHQPIPEIVPHRLAVLVPAPVIEL